MSSPKPPKLITAIDIGSWKISALIAAINDAGEIEVLGTGQRESRGVRRGFIADMERTELAIRDTMDQAERVAQRLHLPLRPLAAWLPHQADAGRAVDPGEEPTQVGDRLFDQIHVEKELLHLVAACQEARGGADASSAHSNDRPARRGMRITSK